MRRLTAFSARLAPVALATVLAALAAAPPPAVAAAADITKIRGDYRKDNKLTRCRFSAQELERARALVRQSPDEAYGAFAGALDGELARINAKFCKNVIAESARKKSSLKVAIVKVAGKGGRDKETVSLRNRSSKRIELRGARLRDRDGKRVSIPTAAIAGKQTLTVSLACGEAGGKRVNACAKDALLDDKGDLVGVLDKKGVVATQRGFGKYADAYRF